MANSILFDEVPFQRLPEPLREDAPHLYQADKRQNTKLDPVELAILPGLQADVTRLIAFLSLCMQQSLDPSQLKNEARSRSLFVLISGLMV